MGAEESRGRIALFRRHLKFSKRLRARLFLAQTNITDFSAQYFGEHLGPKCYHALFFHFSFRLLIPCYSACTCDHSSSENAFLMLVLIARTGFFRFRCESPQVYLSIRDNGPRAFETSPERFSCSNFSFLQHSIFWPLRQPAATINGAALAINAAFHISWILDEPDW